MDIGARLDDIACTIAMLEKDDDLDELSRLLAGVGGWADSINSQDAVDASAEAQALLDQLAGADDATYRSIRDKISSCVVNLQQIAASQCAVGAPEDDEDELENDPEILGEFVSEAQERLADIETALLTLERDPTDLDSLNAAFRSLHTIKGLAGFFHFHAVESLAHIAEDLLDQARSNGLDLSGHMDLMLQATDRLTRFVAVICDDPGNRTLRDATEPGLAGLLSALHDAVKASAGRNQVVASRPAPAGSRTDANLGMESSDSIPVGRESQQSTKTSETVRVDAERLDKLIDLIGELVISQSMAENAAAQDVTQVSRELDRYFSHLSKVTREVQEIASSLRMVPIRSSFRKMRRLARDVARRSNKRVAFEVFGEDTELDKSVVDRIGEPLVHLVRNAIDHGIEADEDERLQAGKPAVGSVQLRAFHKGGSICLELSDDGKGLDRDRILAKARERGLVAEGEELSDREVYRLILQPGFSTAKEISSISGRGVGMDVVAKVIESMGGVLDIRSARGQGSTFSMKLPLTLAVIDGMVVGVGKERFIIPTLSIVRLAKPNQEDRSSLLGQAEMLKVQDELIPIVYLHEIFDIAPDGEADIAVIAESEQGKLALITDTLFGQQQVVIKALSDGLGETPGLSGCAVMPDGRIGLVLDMASLHRYATKDERGNNVNRYTNGEAMAGEQLWT